MKNKLLLIGIIAVLFIAISVGVWATPALTEVWIDDDFTSGDCGGYTWGDDAFDTIQDGINVVAEGGTVNVAAGTYTNDLEDPLLAIPDRYRITKSITLLGAQAGNNPSGSTDRGNESIIVKTNGLPYSLCASDITIDGFMFGNSNPDTGGRLIICDATNNVKIKNCIIQNTPNSSSGHGVYVYFGAQNALISNNTFSNTAWEALNIDGNVTISGNVIKDIPTNKGIRLGPTSSAIVADNIISNTFYEGIASFGSATITDNEIFGCYHGLQLRGNDTNYTVSGNNIHDNQFHGIEIPNYSGEVVTSLNISDNTLSDNLNCGIKVGENTNGSGYHINNNIIMGNGIYGIESLTSVDVDATNNWWGVANGPTHTSNPGGTGDAVSDNVDFIPFLSPNLNLTKTGPTTANQGNNIIYTITYKNEGTFDATNIVVTETYPSEVSYVSATPTPDVGTNNQWTIGTLTPDGEGSISVTVHIK